MKNITNIPDGKPKNHHIVPRCLLKSFQDKNRSIKVFDVSDKEKIFETKIINIKLACCIKYFNTVEINGFPSQIKEEEVWRTCENALPKIIEKIINKVCLTNIDKTNLKNFVRLQKIRDLFTKECIENVFSNEKFYKDYCKGDGPDLNGNYLPAWSDGYFVENTILIQLLEKATNNNSYIEFWNNKQIELIQFDKPMLLTGDCMFTVETNHKYGKNIYLPISPKNLVVFVNVEQHLTPDTEFVDYINNQIINLSQKHVICNNDYSYDLLKTYHLL